MNCRGKLHGHNFLASKCLDCGDQQQTLGVKVKVSKYEKQKKELVKHRIDHSFEELGITMQQHFPKSQWGWMWSLFTKYLERDIRQAFKVCQEKKIHELKYLIGVLKRI